MNDTIKKNGQTRRTICDDRRRSRSIFQDRRKQTSLADPEQS